MDGQNWPTTRRLKINIEFFPFWETKAWTV